MKSGRAAAWRASWTARRRARCRRGRSRAAGDLVDERARPARGSPVRAWAIKGRARDAVDGRYGAMRCTRHRPPSRPDCVPAVGLLASTRRSCGSRSRTRRRPCGRAGGSLHAAEGRPPPPGPHPAPSSASRSGGRQGVARSPPSTRKPVCMPTKPQTDADARRAAFAATRTSADDFPQFSPARGVPDAGGHPPVETLRLPRKLVRGRTRRRARRAPSATSPRRAARDPNGAELRGRDVDRSRGPVQGAVPKLCQPPAQSPPRDVKLDRAKARTPATRPSVAREVAASREHGTLYQPARREARAMRDRAVGARAKHQRRHAQLAPPLAAAAKKAREVLTKRAASAS